MHGETDDIDDDAVGDGGGGALGPCGNQECDRCYPGRWFRVSQVRVERVRHARDVKVPISSSGDESTIAAALAAFDREKGGDGAYMFEIVEEVLSIEPAVAEPRDGDGGTCWHDLRGSRRATGESQ